VEQEGRHLALFFSGFTGGGAQRRMLILAAGFAERGHRVDVVVPRAEGSFRAQLPASARLVALTARFGRLPGVRTRRGLWVLAATRALAGYLARERPDALLSASNPANLAALWARRLARSGARVVVSVNVPLGAATGERQRAWGPLLRALVRRSYGRADAIVANTQGIAVDLEERLAPPRPPIVTIYNPLPVAEIQKRAHAGVDHPWLARGAPPLILAVGKLKLQKDFATLIRAFERVRAQRPAHLVILGEGEERARLEALARELAVAGDVALPGFAPNPFAWMSRASVFVLSSAWEGFSNVLAEALACGCPVVSTDCPSGPAEILEYGRHGALVPVADAGALADAILATLEKPSDPERLRARAASFSVDTAVDRYLEVLVGSHAAARA
jgi:glycosyltransferase involved in cell wall biosynthesis